MMYISYVVWYATMPYCQKKDMCSGGTINSIYVYYIKKNNSAQQTAMHCGVRRQQDLPKQQHTRTGNTRWEKHWPINSSVQVPHTIQSVSILLHVRTG